MLRGLPFVLLALLLGGCTGSSDRAQAEPDPVATKPATLGACRMLTMKDIERPSNESPTVDCAEEHTAETFAVGAFPEGLARADEPDAKELGAYVYGRCQQRFRQFVGADESLALRSTLSWAWFRPEKEAWQQGAQFWRCDVVATGPDPDALAPLPTTAKGALLGRLEDRWLLCVKGPQVAGAPKVPCTEPHDWRAVTTIVLGKKGDPYPGDRLSEVRSRDFCRASVGAWLNYPIDYDFGYTWFHEAEWDSGNRRSVCWAKTDQ